MKRFEGKGIGQYIAFAMAALTLSLTMAACGKKDDGPGPIAVVPGVGATCATCAPTMNKIVASGTTRSINYAGAAQAEMSLNFFGDSSLGNSVQGYYGTIGASGVLRVRVAKTAPCNIPVGDYSITTTMPGQWSGQAFQNLQVQAAGPVVIRMDIPVGMIQATTPAATDWAGATFPYLIKLRAYVTPISVGGQCNLGNIPEYFFED